MNPVESFRNAMEQPADRAKRELLNTRDLANFAQTVERLQNTLGDQFEPLRAQTHRAILDYYNAVAYNKGEAAPKTVPAFLHQAEADVILQAATILKNLEQRSDSPRPVDVAA